MPRSSYTISGCNYNCNEEDEGQNLGMAGCFMVSDSPNKPNICHEAVSKTTIEEDFAFVVADLVDNRLDV